MSILKSLPFFAIICLISLCFLDITSSITIKNGFDKIKLGVNETFNVQGGECREVIIPNNYKKLVLKLASKNIDRVLITDQKLINCNETNNLSDCCSRNSTFCIENVNPTGNEFNLNYCIDYIYLYACNIYTQQLRLLQLMGFDFTNNTDNTNNNIPLIDNNTTLNNNLTGDNITNLTDSTFNNDYIIDPSSSSSAPPVFTYEKKGEISIVTSIIKGQGCQTTENVPETACSSIGLVSCKDNQKCVSDCSYVECRTDSTDPTTRVFAICLPAMLTDSEVLNRCRNHIQFSTLTPQVFKIKCDKLDSDMVYVPKESSHSFFKFLLIAFGVIVLATFITSVYYRFKMSMDGVPPFDPPAILPNFIFPRQSPNY